MKNISLPIISIMSLIFLTGINYGWDGTFLDLGLGVTVGSSFGHTPETASIPSTGIFYFQVPYAGNVNISLKVGGGSGGSSYIFNIAALNYSGGIASWTLIASETHTGGTYTINGSGDYNSGIYKFYFTGNVADYTIYLDESYYELMGTPDYTSHSYTAGSLYTFPLLNRFYPQATSMSISSPDYGSPIGQVGNLSAFYYVPFRPACELMSGVQDAEVFNVDLTAFTQETYVVSMNITALQDLAFTSYSDSIYNTVKLNINEKHNFSISVNQPLAVTDISWYVDGGLVSHGDATNVKYEYSSPQSGLYAVEVIAWDSCGRSISAIWPVAVGQTITQYGNVYNADGTTAISSADVTLNSTSLGYLKQTTTDISGGYIFTGLAAGTYTITVGKDGYETITDILVLSYDGSQEVTEYITNFYLTESNTLNTWSIQVIDYQSLMGITGYDLALYWGSSLVLNVSGGSVVYKKYYEYFNTTFTGSYFEATITNIPSGYLYTAKISKTSYVHWPSGVSPAVVSRTITTGSTNNLDPVYLKLVTTTTTTAPTTTTLVACHGSQVSGCWGLNSTNCVSGYVGIDGVLYNCLYDVGSSDCYVSTESCVKSTTTTTTSATTTTHPPTPGLDCSGSEVKNCYLYDNDAAGCVSHYETIFDLGYQCVYDAGLDVCDPDYGTTCKFNFTTTTTTIATTTTTRKPTTTTSTTQVPTTLLNVSTANFTFAPPVYDCSNISGKIYAGNWTQASFCAFVLPIGPEWAIYGVIMFIVLIAYSMTRSINASLLAGLLLCAMFMQFFPPVIVYLLPLPVGFIVALIFMLMFGYKPKRAKQSYAYTEDFGN